MGSVRTELEADKHAISVSEFIPERLYFVTFRNKTHRNTTDVHYFTTDEELVYINYYNDFGPLNLAAIVKYIRQVNFKLRSPGLASKTLVHFTSVNEKKRVNAAMLIAVFAMVYLEMSPIEAFNRLSSIKHPFLSFPDATMGESQFKIRLIDCLNAVRKAIYFGIINFDDFDLEEFEKMENIKFGDLSWIVPHKFLAFSGPVDSPQNECFHAPEHYIEYFKEHGVKTVIRLNKAVYNSKSFSSAGIAHYDLQFDDGYPPTHDVFSRFLNIAENSSGAIAVHCKAGLGRTGTLIAAYLVKHYRMTALEAIAWLRICRPGSVIGPQQAWLEQMEPALWNAGDTFRMRFHGGADRIPHHKYGIYSCRTSKVEGYYPSTSGEGQPLPSLDVDPLAPEVGYPLSQNIHASIESGTQGDKLNARKRLKDVQNNLSYKPKAAKLWNKSHN